MLPGEDPESLVCFHVVDQHDPAGPHRRCRLLHFEHDVLSRVQAVVDEHPDAADLGDHRWQPLLTRALHVRPARAARVGDGRAGLHVQMVIEGIGQIDAPQVAVVVLIHRLEHDPARHAVRDPGLDDGIGPGMQDRAPRGAAQRAVGVAEHAVRVAAEAEPLCGQQGSDAGHELIDARALRTRPRCAEQAVQVLGPVLVDHIVLVGPVPLLHQPGQRLTHPYWVTSERTQQAHDLLLPCLSPHGHASIFPQVMRLPRIPAIGCWGVRKRSTSYLDRTVADHLSVW
jgi:hypothetical protein